MKRQIKFRQPVLDNDGNFVYFHYWGYMFPKSPALFVVPLENDKFKYSEQFTGLQDKNGNDIYENSDLLSVKITYKSTRSNYSYTTTDKDGGKEFFKIEVLPCVIRWNGERGIYEFWNEEHKASKPFYMEYTQIDKMEIIGNIHQTPQLIERWVTLM